MTPEILAPIQKCNRWPTRYEYLDRRELTAVSRKVVRICSAVKDKACKFFAENAVPDIRLKTFHHSLFLSSIVLAFSLLASESSKFHE